MELHGNVKSSPQGSETRGQKSVPKLSGVLWPGRGMLARTVEIDLHQYGGDKYGTSQVIKSQLRATWRSFSFISSKRAYRKS